MAHSSNAALEQQMLERGWTVERPQAQYSGDFSARLAGGGSKVFRDLCKSPARLHRGQISPKTPNAFSLFESER